MSDLNMTKVLFGVHLHRWIVTYPLDKVLCPLNNWGQNCILQLYLKGKLSCTQHNQSCTLSRQHLHPLEGSLMPVPPLKRLYERYTQVSPTCPSCLTQGSQLGTPFRLNPYCGIFRQALLKRQQALWRVMTRKSFLLQGSKHVSHQGAPYKHVQLPSSRVSLTRI